MLLILIGVGRGSKNSPPFGRFAGAFLTAKDANDAKEMPGEVEPRPPSQAIIHPSSFAPSRLGLRFWNDLFLRKGAKAQRKVGGILLLLTPLAVALGGRKTGRIGVYCQDDAKKQRLSLDSGITLLSRRYILPAVPLRAWSSRASCAGDPFALARPSPLPICSYAPPTADASSCRWRLPAC